MSERLKVLDLFSGIGGFSLGLEPAGMETVAFCEHDDRCQKVLSKNWPNVPIWKDISKLKTIYICHEKYLNELGIRVDSIDVVCGGWPCQGNSQAGKLLGSEDERSGLWKELYRVIKEISPRWVILENVANVRNTQLAEVLKDLWKIGYDSEWYIIPASAVGAPHLRERLFVIAYPNKNRSKQSVSIPTRDQEKGIQFRGTAKNVTDTSGPRLQGYIQKEISLLCECESEITKFGDRIVPSFGEFRNWLGRALRERNGVSDRVDKNRLKQMGNAVVPQILTIIGEGIVEYERKNEAPQGAP